MQTSEFDQALQQLNDKSRLEHLSESVLPDKGLDYNKRHKRSDNNPQPGPSQQSVQNPRTRIRELLEILAIRERRYGSDHIEVVEVLSSLATNYFKLGDYQKATEFLRKALTINESHYGPDHIEVSKTLNDLALSYLKLGDYQKAKEYLERTLAIQKKIYGPGHIEVTKTLARLSHIYVALEASQRQKQLSSSQEQRQEVRREDTDLVNPKIKELLEILATKESSHGSNHLQTAMALKDLADAYGELKDYQKQKEAIEKALPILERDFGSTNPTVIRMLKNLGDAYNALGNTQKAHELHAKASGASEQYEQIALGVSNLSLKAKESSAYVSLLVAAREGNLSLVKHLIEVKSVDINEKDDHGNTSLHLATEKCRSGVVEYLVSKGADVNAINEDRNTPLHLTISTTDHDRASIIAMDLIDGGADVEIENNAGKTFLQQVAMNHKLDVMKYLVEHGNIILLRGTKKGKNFWQKDKNFWQYVLVDKDKTKTFFAQEDVNSIEFTDYGKILHSGWGQNPPENAIEELIVLLPSRLLKEPSWLVQQNELLEALARKERRYGSDHIEVAKTLYHLGNVYFNLEDYKKAKESYERALPIFEKHYGSDHVTAAKILHELGNAYLNLGNYQKAKESYERALPIFEKHYGSDHVEVARTLHELGNAYFYLEDYQKAKELLERALPTLEKHCPSCVTVAKALHDLGNAYYKLPDNQKAGELYEKALAIKQKHYDSNHVEVVKTLGNLGSVAHASENYQKAKKIFERVLPHTEKHFGSEHFKVGEILYNLGNTYYGLKDYQKAKEFYDRALVIRERHYGSDHIEVAKTLNHLGDTYNELEDYQKAKESYERALSVLEKHYSSDHIGAAVILNNLGLVYDKLEDYQKAKESYERASLIERKHYGSDHVEVEECLPSTSSGSRGRRKREAKECELSWEDVDGFNEEKEESRDLSKVRINSDEFIDYIKSTPMSEAKLTQLVQLADKVQVTGKSQGPVNKLISNKKVINHLSRAGRISSIAMHGMIGKATLAAFLNGDYQGVAINLGFVAGGQGFAKIAEAVSIKGAGSVSDGKLLLGRSLKAASPFLARGTSAFVVYDLINQIKEFKNGTKEALVGVVGDSIYLGVDSAEIGIEIAEAFEVLEGVSSVTGPIGAAIGAVIFVGTDVYLAVKRVDKIDEIIHLTTKERFIEGLRAFIGIKPEQHIEELMEEKQVNNQLVKQGLEYLKQHSDIQRYVSPTGKSVIDSCRIVKYIESCPLIGLRTCYRDLSGNLFIIREREKCTTKLQLDLDNKVLLNRKRTDIKWSRAKPDNPNGGELFCLPQGDSEQISSDGAYLCNNAVGITDSSANKTGNYTFFNLGEGDDYLEGFSDSPNIISISNGDKRVYGGNEGDTVILQGDVIKGKINGGHGTDTIDLGNFAPTQKLVQIYLNQRYIVHKGYGNSHLGIININRVSARKEKTDRIDCACSTEYVDGRGGESGDKDIVVIPSSSCFYKLQVIVRPNTIIYNQALRGNFSYVIPTGSGEANVYLFPSESRHNFFFNYTLLDVESINVSNNDITFNFATSGKLFNVTILSNTNNTFYKLNDNTEIKVGKKNLYAIQGSNKSVDEIISNYPAIADRLRMSLFVQSLLSNETVAIGHGNHDVLRNDPYHKSHLVGNGGENIFTVTSGYETLDNSKLPIPEVVIYDVDKENLIDTLDLRQIKQQIMKDLGKEVKARTTVNSQDLLIELFNPNSTKSLVTVRLKGALINNWHERLQVILNNVPMKMEEFDLKPLPLVFGEDKKIIVITPNDVEKESKLVISKKSGDYVFARSGNDLIITNAFDRNLTSNELCTISLSKFYKKAKMHTLAIKFTDKEILLKNEMDRINNANTLIEQLDQYKNITYSSVLNNTITNKTVGHQRKRREVKNYKDQELFYAQNNANNGLKGEKVISGAESSFAWIKTIICAATNTIADSFSRIGGFISSPFKASALPSGGVNSSQEESFQESSRFANVRRPGDQYIAQFNNGVLAQNINLGLYLFKSFLDTKYPLPKLHSVTFKEAQVYALNITEGFEQVLKDTAVKSGISVTSLNFNPLTLQPSIVRQIRNGTYSEVSKILYSSAKKACPEFEQTDKFLDCLSTHLKEVLAEKEVVLLSGKQNATKPMTYLSDVSMERPAITVVL